MKLLPAESHIEALPCVTESLLVLSSHPPPCRWEAERVTWWAVAIWRRWAWMIPRSLEQPKMKRTLRWFTTGRELTYPTYSNISPAVTLEDDFPFLQGGICWFPGGYVDLILPLYVNQGHSTHFDTDIWNSVDLGGIASAFSWITGNVVPYISHENWW